MKHIPGYYNLFAKIEGLKPLVRMLSRDFVGLAQKYMVRPWKSWVFPPKT